MKIKLRDNKGIAGIDIAIAIILALLFIELIANLFINTRKQNVEINSEAYATNIAINVAEWVDETHYSNVYTGKDLTGETFSNGQLVVDTSNKKYHVQIVCGEDEPIPNKERPALGRSAQKKQVTITVKYRGLDNNQIKEYSITKYKYEEV